MLKLDLAAEAALQRVAIELAPSRRHRSASRCARALSTRARRRACNCSNSAAISGSSPGAVIGQQPTKLAEVEIGRVRRSAATARPAPSALTRRIADQRERTRASARAARRTEFGRPVASAFAARQLESGAGVRTCQSQRLRLIDQISATSWSSNALCAFALISRWMIFSAPCTASVATWPRNSSRAVADHAFDLGLRRGFLPRAFERSHRPWPCR